MIKPDHHVLELGGTGGDNLNDPCPALPIMLTLSRLLFLAFVSTPVLSRDVAAEESAMQIFSQHCAGCHGHEKQAAGLDFLSFESILRGSDQAPVVLPGQGVG